MTDWRALETELDAWTQTGQSATLWWRDDDAVTATPQLDRLHTLSSGRDIPAALAVIPARADRQLAKIFANNSLLTPLIHGLSHTNHAPPTEKKAELGAHRPSSKILDDIRNGAEQLTALCPSSLPVLVPPWNRIATDVVRELPEIGITGLSTFQPRQENTPNLLVVNTHVDIIEWRGTRGFAGTKQVLEQLVSHLASRRNGTVDPTEPTGILTHHLVHDDDCWQFLNDLFSLTRSHPAATWLAAPRIFEPAATG